jgi:hypothetical protein
MELQNGKYYYSVKEYAASYGVNEGTGQPFKVSPDSVRRWIRECGLKAFKFPQRVKKARGKRRREVFLIPYEEGERFRRACMTS